MSGDAGNRDVKLADKTAGYRVGYNSLTNKTNKDYIHLSKTSLVLLISATRFGPFFGKKIKK